MTSLQQRAVPASEQEPGPGPRLLAFVTGVSVIGALPYAAGVLLPYVVNGLHRLPLAEVASGAHDPKDLWPSGFGGGLLQLFGFLSLAVTPVAMGFCAAVSAVLAVWAAVRATRSTWALAVGFAVLALACGAALLWLLGPTAGALATWRLD